MSGEKLLLDTNTFIYFFEGRRKATEWVVQAAALYFSPISEIELLSAIHLSSHEIVQIKEFLSLCHRVELTSDVIKSAIEIRRTYRFKTPDAIIVASALCLGIPLLSADSDFQKIPGLILIPDIT